MSDSLNYDYLRKERVSLLDQLNEFAQKDKYKFEKKTTDAITNGNKDKLEKVLNSLETDTILKEFNQEELLQEVKYFLINVNTYSRIAAENGGVLPLYLHIISERVTYIIQTSESVDYLMNVYLLSFLRQYCDIAANFSTNSYSEVMKKIVMHITANLTSDLTLKEIAELHDMHPVHLARKFKQETGVTFISYINQQRIFLAKYYFQLQQYQLSEVAYLSGFNSHSYFTKVFKKITGEIPTKYIRDIKDYN